MAANVRAIKSRIGNIENIAQITRAMNAIAMTKVARMKKRLASVRPYAEEIEAFIGRLIAQLPADTPGHPLMNENGSDNVGILVLNSDRGLCGRYKGDLNRKTEELLSEYGNHARLLAGGERARVYFERHGIRPLRTYAHAYDTPTLEASDGIAADVCDLYLRGEIGRVIVVSMQFVSDLAQRLVTTELLPATADPVDGDVLIEPTPAGALDVAIPLLVQARLYRAILETKASEDAIRRQAMKSATDNAEELVQDLTRTYNRARQQAITLELADIIGGADALRSD